jgi:chromosome segregation ATPase
MKQLLQLVLIISLPLIIISFLITTFLHYRRKRKNRGIDTEALEAGNAFLSGQKNRGAVLAMPKFAVSENTADYTLLNYGRQLEESKEQYYQLREELEKVKTKYHLLLSGYLGDPKDKAEAMVAGMQKEIKSAVLKITQLQQALEFSESQRQNSAEDQDEEKLQQQAVAYQQQLQHLQSVIDKQQRSLCLLEDEKSAQLLEINKLGQLLKELQAAAQLAGQDARTQELFLNQQVDELNKLHFDENSRIQDQLKELGEAYKRLQDENRQLQQQLADGYAMANAANEQNGQADIPRLAQQLEQLVKERDSLRASLVEQGYLNELVNEKKHQIEFLQHQLEERVRSAHQANQQYAEASGQLKEAGEAAAALQQQIAVLEEKWQAAVQESAQLQQSVNRNGEEVSVLQQAVSAKSACIAELENELNTVKEQHALLSQQHSRQESAFSELSRELSQARSGAKEYEQKWEQSSRLISRIYRELEGNLYHEETAAPRSVALVDAV